MKFFRTTFFRYFAAFTAMNILFQAVSPTITWALTSGPTQPELSSFEPVGTTQLVDLFSGDFNYNIPLMTVPGPNGGYPINLAYHAGIGMEQEASWVGLGWNINPGVINREMRGIPDDFKGDSITKKISMKPQRTYSFFGGSVFTTEIFGWNANNASYQVMWNSYKGVGTQISLELGSKDAHRSPFAKGLSLSYSSDGGLGVSPSFSIHHTGKRLHETFHFGFDFNSREGLTAVKMSGELRGVKTSRGRFDPTETRRVGKIPYGAGTSFSGGSFVPNITDKMTGFQMRLGIKWGTSPAIGTYKYKWMLGGAYSQNQLASSSTSTALNSYGYDYLQSTAAGNNVIMDINREKDVPVIKNSPRLPVPQNTYDVYYVKGQGIGSVFRPCRSDFGILTDNPVTSTSTGGNLNLELGTGSAFVIGADAGVNYSSSYSGMWNDVNFYDPVRYVKYVNNGTGSNDEISPGYEPFYFRSSGEITAYETGRDVLLPGGENAIRFNLGLKFSGISFKPKVKDASGIVPAGSNPTHVNTREKRNQSVQKRFNWEISRSHSFKYGYNTNNFPKHIYQINQFPGRTGVVGSVYDYSFNGYLFNANERRNYHIGEMSVINPDGNRYTYGIPVYNLKHKEASFSAGAPTQDSLNNTYFARKWAKYVAGSDNSTSNNMGRENYYMSNEIPPYVHSYLLTLITSPDYVDLTGDGPSDDDLGYFVKFNYSKSLDTYNWRIPYHNAAPHKGFLSDTQDDKASYTFGQKEIYILNSIETKTHIAVFTLGGTFLEGRPTTGQRRDAYGVNGENNVNYAYNGTGFANQYSHYLYKIDLFSKQDPNYAGGTSKPIKTVHFEYNWDLCGNVDDNIGGTFDRTVITPQNTEWSVTSYNGSTDLNVRKGKMTLKKVWFSYLGNNKGKLSPYVFDYHENPVAYAGENPDYSLAQMDRWGNYKPDNGLGGVNNEDNPYVDQSLDYNHNGAIEDGVITTTSTADIDLRKKHASVWTLKTITLPSGGMINIDYEQDQYQYVQDKRATQMYRVLGVGKSSSGTYSNASFAGSNLNAATYDANQSGVLYFELDRPLTVSDAPAVMARMLSGIDFTYYKAFMRLKKVPGLSSPSYDAYDYVNGYAHLQVTNPGNSFATVDLSTGTPTAGNYGLVVGTTAPSVTDPNGNKYYKVGYIFLKPELMNDLNSAGPVINPIRKAAWQYLRMQRSDLFDQPTTGLGVAQDLLPVLQVLRNAVGLLTNYYTQCLISNWANKIITVPSDPGLSFEPLPTTYYKPSFIRLNSSYDKYGGGNRVKSITINDNWSAMATGESSFSYGQEFTYQLPDGSSSGVAEYEPMVGGDEIALRLPVKYSSSRFLAKDNALFTEEPYGESYYPSANVGYSRVIVRDLKRMVGSTEINKLTTTGFSVSEFYTAKDFPVVPDKTDMGQKIYPIAIQIPFVGSFSFNNRGYSMGYKIELNNMHGKAKSVAAYSSNASLFTTGNTILSAPISRTEYIYNTDPNVPNRLSSTVNVLNQEGQVSSETMGRNSDFIVDMREHSDIGRDFTITYDIDGQIPYPILGWAIPYTNYGEAMFRSIVTMKVISKNGILKETRNYQDGSMVITKNLLYDALNGEPLLTQVTNEYNKVIYNYSLPAQWTYENMGPAYKNIDARFFNFSITTGTLTVTGITDLNDYFVVGDRVSLVDNTAASTLDYWVTSIDANGANLVLKDENGVGPTAASNTNNNKYLTISQSGRRNLQSIKAGLISSLADPTASGSRQFPLFDLYNANPPITSPFTLVNYSSCDGQFSNINVTGTLSGRQITFSSNAGTATLLFTSGDYPATAGDLNKYRFYKAGNKVKIVNVIASPNITTYGKWSDPNNAYPMCMINNSILNTQAVQYKDIWAYNYADAGNPQGKYFNGTGWSALTALQTLVNNNPYRYGGNNIWRMLRSNAYLVARNQSTSTDLNPKTDPSRDGTFANFTIYNWDASPASNSKWTYVNEVTQYNPYGFEVENKDAIGNLSAALYGYTNTSVTAVAKNAGYFETAFDGFEDYPSGFSSTNTGHGHLNFTYSAGGNVPLVNSAAAHTGDMVVSLGAATTLNTTATVDGTNLYFNPKATKQYVITAWFKVGTAGPPTISVTGNGVASSSAIVDPFKIEGWQRVEATFTTQSASGGTVNISMGFGAGSGVIDDIRIQPFNSSMKTFVYNPITLWLAAEHDERGYSTFYNYDEEGTLVQVKKETINGIMTIKTSRQNLKQ